MPGAELRRFQTAFACRARSMATLRGLLGFFMAAMAATCQGNSCASDDAVLLQSTPAAHSPVLGGLTGDSAEVMTGTGFKRDFQDEGLYYDLRTYTRNGTVFYPWMFSKTLAHDEQTGFPTKEDVDRVLAAEKKPTQGNLDAIVLSDSPNRVRKLEGLTNTRNKNDIGALPESAVFPFFYPIDSAESAFEMAEVYARALLRDVPFADYSTNPTVQMVVDSLNQFPSKTSHPTSAGLITEKTLFRGIGPGETVGPYVSQFLYKTHRYGAYLVEQRYEVELDPTNMLSMDGWRAVQNGENPASTVRDGTALAATGRVLGSIVHRDPLFQLYYQAALVALQQGVGTEGFDHAASTAWTTSGPPDIFASVAHVAVGALRTAWWQKWGVGMRIRPEAYAQRYELARTQPQLLADVPGLAALKNNIEVATDIINAVLADNGARVGNQTALLAVMYPEGSPTHPSLPGGHAAVAGACVTVLKAMLKTFDDDAGTIETKWVTGTRTASHSVDGQNLVGYSDADAADMTVNGELNKLASNVALGRDFGGVHFRADNDGGILAGEDYAISYLADKLKAYAEASIYNTFEGWTLKKFDGSVVKITASGARKPWRWQKPVHRFWRRSSYYG